MLELVGVVIGVGDGVGSCCRIPLCIAHGGEPRDGEERGDSFLALRTLSRRPCPPFRCLEYALLLSELEHSLGKAAMNNE